MDRRVLPFVVIVIALQVGADEAHGEEVQWRHDYQAALRESKEKNLPLFIDFGFQGCMWCNKLDATAFRDPGIAQTLNKSFIPTRVDTDKTPGIAQSFGVFSFPTLIAISPAGKILDKQEGYVEPGPLSQKLHAVASMTRPAVATKPALALEQVPPTAPDPQSARSQQAKQLLKVAQEDFLAACYLACLENCQRVQASFADLPEAADASRLAARIIKDADLSDRLEKELVARLARLNMDRAESLLKKNDARQAVSFLERVVESSPESRDAQLARFYLTGIRLGPEVVVSAQAP